VSTMHVAPVPEGDSVGGATRVAAPPFSFGSKDQGGEP
jgi:hypothetical protein